MRKALLLFAVLGLAGSLWAADPIIGTWKLNIEKSSGTEGMDSPAIEITDTYRELDSGFMELRSKRIFMDGTSDFDIMTHPAQGGALKSQIMPPDISLFEILLGPGEWCGVYIKDGKQIVTRHKVVSEDGKTLTQTIKAIDDDGLIEIIEVFDRQ